MSRTKGYCIHLAPFLSWLSSREFVLVVEWFGRLDIGACRSTPARISLLANNVETISRPYNDRLITRPACCLDPKTCGLIAAFTLSLAPVRSVSLAHSFPTSLGTEGPAK